MAALRWKSTCRLREICKSPKAVTAKSLKCRADLATTAQDQGKDEMSGPITLLLVDDQALFREGLRTLLSIQPDFDIVGEAANGEEALLIASTKQPAVVL